MIGLLLTVLALLFGASAEPVPSSAAAPLAGRTLSGGLCPTGACTLALEIATDGTWRSGGRVGRLDADELADLTAAVADTRLDQALPFTGTCPMAYDGSEATYSWAGHEVSSCEQIVDPGDPLVAWFADFEATPGAP